MPEQSSAIDREIKRFQALLPHLDREYRELLLVFETLKSIASKPFIDKIVQTPRMRCFSVVMIALLSRCVIITHRLLKAGKPTNPSLCYLARPFLEKNQKHSAKVLTRLEQLHVDWPELIVRWKGLFSYYIPKPADQLPSKGAEERKKEFWRRINLIRSEWAFLEAARESKLDDVRNMVFAHLELIEETLESPLEELKREESIARGESEPAHVLRYAFREIREPKPEDVWQILNEVVPRIGNCITQVGYVWQKANIEYQIVQRAAQHSAAAFWELEPRDQSKG